MPPFRTPRSFVRPVAAVLLAALLQGCTHWTPVPEPKSLATHPEKTVRLTLSGEAKHKVVKHPTIVGDSIVWESPERGSVHVSQVAWIEARGLDPVATGFFALVAVTWTIFKVVRN